MKRIALAVIAAAGFAMAPASACSCVDFTAEERVARHELIFTGSARQTVRSDEEGSDTVYTVFIVKEMLKGEGAPGDEIYLFHPYDSGGNCGVDFADGKDALVIASDPPDDQPPSTNLCSMLGITEDEVRAVLKKKAP
jgi:hypothetical protein